MRKVRRFYFTLTVYFTDTYGEVCLKKCNCFAFLMFTERLGPLPAYLLYFYLALISNKCIRLIDNVSEVLKPNPEGGFKSSESVMQQPHAES